MLLRFTPRGVEFIRVRRRPPVIVTLRQSSSTLPGAGDTSVDSVDAPESEGVAGGAGSLPPASALSAQRAEKSSSAAAADRIIIPLRECTTQSSAPKWKKSSMSVATIAEPPPSHPFMLLLEWNPVTKSHWLKWPLRGMSLAGTGSSKAAKAAEQTAINDNDVAASGAAIGVTIYPSGTLLRSLVTTGGIGGGKKRRDKREMMVEGELDSQQQQSELIPPDLPVEAGEPQPQSLSPGTMMELKHGDVIQFLQRASLTNDAKVVEYVYAINPRGYSDPVVGTFRRHKSSSSCDTIRHRSASRSGGGKADGAGRRKRGTGSAEESDASNTTASDSTTATGGANVKLPEIRGSAIRPLVHSDKFRTPPRAAGEPRRLCQLRANGPLMTQQSIDVTNMERSGVPMLRSHSASRLGSAHSRNALPLMVTNVRPQLGSQLLQEVIRLQSELQHKESELMAAREGAAVAESDQPKQPPMPIPVSMSVANGSLQTAGGSTRGSARSETIVGPQTRAEVNQLIYETFFTVCCSHLEALYQRVSQASIRDNADIFAELCRSLQEPFSFHLMQIHSDCASEFERHRSNADAGEEMEQIYELFDAFIKARIYPFSKALDSLVPLLKESAHLAKESSRAESIFTAWARDFSTQLTLSPQWQVVDCKVDDLVNQFRHGHIGKHWLTQSLVPLLKVLIHEQQSKEEDGKRKDAVYHDARAKIPLPTTKIEAEPNDSTIPGEIILPPGESGVSSSVAPLPTRAADDTMLSDDNDGKGKSQVSEHTRQKRSLPESINRDESVVADSNRSQVQTTTRPTDVEDSELGDECSLPVSASRTPRTASQLDKLHDLEVEVEAVSDKEELAKATAELLAVDELYETIGKERRRSFGLSRDDAIDQASTIRKALISLRETIPHQPSAEEAAEGSQKGTPRPAATETIAEYNDSVTKGESEKTEEGDGAKLEELVKKVLLTPLKLLEESARGEEKYSRAQTATAGASGDTSRSEPPPYTAGSIMEGGGLAGHCRVTAPPVVIVRSVSEAPDDSPSPLLQLPLEEGEPSDADRYSQSPLQFPLSSKAGQAIPVQVGSEGEKGPEAIKEDENGGAVEELKSAIMRSGQQRRPPPVRTQSASQQRKQPGTLLTPRRQMTYDGKFPGMTPLNSPQPNAIDESDVWLKSTRQREDEAATKQTEAAAEAGREGTPSSSRKVSEVAQQETARTSRASRASSGKGSSHRHLQAIEFWQLAAMLAQMLSVQLPVTPFTTDGSEKASEAEEKNLEDQTVVESELQRRQLAVQSIMAKLSNLLEELRQIHQEEPTPPITSPSAASHSEPSEKEIELPGTSSEQKPPPSRGRKRSSLTPANTYHYTTRSVRESRSGGN